LQTLFLFSDVSKFLFSSESFHKLDSFEFIRMVDVLIV